MATEAPVATKRIVLGGPQYTVTLKQLVLEDAEPFFNLVAVAPHLLSHQGNLTASNFSSVESVAASILNPNDPNLIRFGIWDNENLVGAVDLTLSGSGNAWLDFWVSHNHRGGYRSSRAIRPLADYAFGELHLDQINCKVVIPNTPAIKNLEKAGFKNTSQSEVGGATTLIYTLNSPRTQ